MKKATGKIPTRSAILKTIKRLEPKLRKLKVTGVYLFGSFARGEAELKSDIDIAVTCEDGVTLFVLSDIKHLLEEALHRQVDLVMRDAIRKEFRESIEREMIRAA